MVDPVIAQFSSPVKHLRACHPLIVGQVVLSGEVMDVFDQAAHDLAHSRRGSRSHGGDDDVGEVRVHVGLGERLGTHVD